MDREERQTKKHRHYTPKKKKETKINNKEKWDKIAKENEEESDKRFKSKKQRLKKDKKGKKSQCEGLIVGRKGKQR